MSTPVFKGNAATESIAVKGKREASRSLATRGRGGRVAGTVWSGQNASIALANQQIGDWR